MRRLTPEVSEQLIAGGLDELVFSLDGVNPVQADAVRRGGSLDTGIANIRGLPDLGPIWVRPRRP